MTSKHRNISPMNAPRYLLVLPQSVCVAYKISDEEYSLSKQRIFVYLYLENFEEFQNFNIQITMFFFFFAVFNSFLNSKLLLFTATLWE